MKYKRSAFITLVLCLLMAVFIGCKQKTPEVQEAQEQPEQTPATTGQAKSAKIWTDEDFIEYWAQLTYLTEKYAKDPNIAKQAEELKNLYKKLGIEEGEEENFSQGYEKWLAKWQQRATADPEKGLNEWQKLMERMEKRVEELRQGK